MHRPRGSTPPRTSLGVSSGAPPYSGQPATGVQLQVTVGTTTAGLLGVMATNPMSRIGEFGPENTSLTAPVTAPTVPSRSEEHTSELQPPGPVICPPLSAIVGAMKPLPARRHPSPFMS